MDVDMIERILVSPPVAFLIFFGVLTAGYLFLQQHAAKGKDHPEKHLPYSGGQTLPPTEVRLSYKAFFRIGLLFGIAHVAVLVLALLPLDWGTHQIGLIYLAGISISAFVLARTETGRTGD
jgi:NADH:ubiquinone oxidoreductase subunit 3 (subunit A)